MLDLRKALKQATLNKNTTVSDVAARLGVNRSTLYSAFFNGNPQLETVKQVANELGYKLSEFIELGEE